MVKWNVEPRPLADSAQMRPPCRSTIVIQTLVFTPQLLQECLTCVVASAATARRARLALESKPYISTKAALQ